MGPTFDAEAIEQTEIGVAHVFEQPQCREAQRYRDRHHYLECRTTKAKLFDCNGRVEFLYLI